MSLTPDQAARAANDLATTFKTLKRDNTVPEERIDRHRVIQQGATIKNAERLWRRVSRDCSFEHATSGMSGPTAWTQFIDTMRTVRDNPPADAAFPDQWGRDCNFILRVCGEIAYVHSR